MENKIKKIKLFTLTACPMGRTIGTVLNELQELMPEIEFEKVYVEIQPEIANHYRIKKNPTTLFLNDVDRELYRFDDFKETKEILKIIEDIQSGKITNNEEREENKTSIEEYTIFLFKTESILPVNVVYQNTTSIKAPRITAINLLLNTKMEGYQNPFPLKSELVKVGFNNNRGQVTLKVSEKVNEERLKKMKLLLQKTLELFGIDEIDLIIE